MPPQPSLRKLWPLLAASLLVVFLSLSLRLSASLRDALEDELTSRLRIAARLILGALEQSGSVRLSPSDPELQNRVSEIREATRVSEIVLYDGNGRLLGGVPRSPVVPRQIRLPSPSGSLKLADPTFRDPERDPSGGLTLVVPISSEHDIGAILVRIDREGIHELAAVDLLFQLGKLFAGIAFAVGLLIILRWGARGSPESPARAAPVIASSDVDIVLDTMKEVVTTLKDSETEYRDLWTAAASDAERYRVTNDLILASISSGLVAFDTDGRVTMFNPASERILQVMAREILGRTVGSVFGEEDRLAGLARELLENERGTSRMEIERSTKGGDALWIGISSSVIRSREGLLVGGIFLIADITETKRLREAMNLKDRLAAVGEMSAGIAHEVKNSAHSLLGFANLLREDVGESDLPLPVRGILSEVESLRMLVQGILEFSRPSNLVKEPRSINEIVRETTEAISEAARTAGVSVVLDVTEALPRAFVDYQALKRAFLNLALNAIQAMETQGKLTISTRMAELLEGEGATSSSGWIRIGFHDTGPGIPEADRWRIFTPFYTTKREGSGLGLALVHRTITDHEGRIRLHSRIGIGTEFVIHLPART